MKVLLTTLNAKYIHSNLAIRLLYQLNKDVEGLAWKEFTLKEPLADIAAYCAGYDVVAFSTYIWNYTATIEVARAIKMLNPDVRILLGGPEVSYEWETCIQDAAVDFIISGEGEIPFQQFLQQYPHCELVPSLIWKNEAGVQQNLPAPMFDLTQVNDILPYVDDERDSLRDRVLYVETSRGCPYHCAFCLASLDNKVRQLPMPAIKENLLFLMTHGRVIKFLDRTFNVRKDFSLEIFQIILDHHHPGNVFQFEITADIVHPDIIRFIQMHIPAGLFRFEIGIQTLNRKANLEVERRQDFDKTRAVIQQLQGHVAMHLDLIAGLPFDSFADIRYSFEEVFRLFAPELQLGFLKFLKGTPVRKQAAMHGYRYQEKPPYEIIDSLYLTVQELDDIRLLEQALEMYWNKNRAQSTLRYVALHYSSFDFLLGVGKAFALASDFHHHKLQDIYRVLHTYIEKAYPEDKMLQELVAFDYYTYPKIRPARLLPGPCSEAYCRSVLKARGYPEQGYRYFLLPISFDIKALLSSSVFKQEAMEIIIRYDGVHKAGYEQFPVYKELAGSHHTS